MSPILGFTPKAESSKAKIYLKNVSFSNFEKTFEFLTKVNISFKCFGNKFPLKIVDFDSIELSNFDLLMVLISVQLK